MLSLTVVRPRYWPPSGSSNRDGTRVERERIDPIEIGERNAPPIAEKPYKVIFEANLCIGTDECAAVSDD